MRNVVRRAINVVALSLAVAACIAQNGERAPSDQSTGGGGDEPAPSDTVVAGGGDTCIRSSRPRKLRQVRVTDSRLLEPNTVVLAASPDPQTLWLPDASDNAGAMVIVKEARNADRRVTVLVLGKDAEGNDAETEYVDSSARSSRTFVVATGDDCASAWELLDPAE
jgi:hypothetical protein